ncbi:unnamed protein product, partial [Lampetra fluviatilis]
IRRCCCCRCGSGGCFGPVQGAAWTGRSVAVAAVAVAAGCPPTRPRQTLTRPAPEVSTRCAARWQPPRGSTR